MPVGCRKIALLLAWTAVGLLAAARDTQAAPAAWQTAVKHEAFECQRVPVLGPDSTLSPAPPAAHARAAAPGAAATPRGSTWTRSLAAPYRIFHDIRFATPSLGFVAGEHGIVYRTVDGGRSWGQVMDLGYPFYWYGIDAPSAQDVVLCGFQSRSGQGILCWSHDAGATWGPVLALAPAAMLAQVRFADRLHGICTTIGSGDVFYTANGGESASDWHRVAADPTGGWFTGSFTWSPPGEAYLAGIHLARSTDGGASWTVRSSADPVFDGAAEFLASGVAFTGGGTIFPESQGWVHRSTDAGARWSGRLAVFSYPVRALKFLDSQHGWAAGGNILDGSGGIHGTIDGGESWSSELECGCELSALELARSSPDSVDLWCCGYTADLEGRVYHRRIGASRTAPAALPGAITERSSVRSFPNPFNPATTLSFYISSPESVLVEIFDPTGRMIRQLRAGTLGSGNHQLAWDGRDQEGQRLGSGVFFFRLRAGREVHGGTLVLVR